MIDITELKIVSAISQGQLISEVLTEQEYNTYLNTFIYPIAAIPTYSFSSTIGTLFPTITERLDYFKSLLAFGLPQYYTTEELNVFKYYLLLWCGDISIHLNNLVNDIENAININTNKNDVWYCINELKYSLALFYAQNQQQFHDKLVQIIPELEQIAAAHNRISLKERKNI